MSTKPEPVQACLDLASTDLMPYDRFSLKTRDYALALLDEFAEEYPEAIRGIWPASGEVNYDAYQWSKRRRLRLRESISGSLRLGVPT